MKPPSDDEINWDQPAGGKFPIYPLFILNRQRSAPASTAVRPQQHTVN